MPEPDLPPTAHSGEGPRARSRDRHAKSADESAADSEHSGFFPGIFPNYPHHRASRRVSPSSHEPVGRPAARCDPRTVRAALLIALAVSVFMPPEPTWVWPVDYPQRVVRDFQAPQSEWGPGHRGLDLRAPAGTDVRAPVSGRVHFRGPVAGRGVVTIRAGEGVLISMEPVRLDPELGSRVRTGQTIGTVAPGHCPGGCVHIGLRIDGDYRSPARELGILRRAHLVPYPSG